MKKSFNTAENPALSYISQPVKQEVKAEIQEPATTTQETKEECKTRRLQLLFTPSFTQLVKDTAWNERKSVNQFIIDCITEHIEKEAK